jgi:hypothetical protein
MLRVIDVRPTFPSCQLDSVTTFGIVPEDLITRCQLDLYQPEGAHTAKEVVSFYTQ